MICKALCIAILRDVKDFSMKHYRWIWVNVNMFFRLLRELINVGRVVDNKTFFNYLVSVLINLSEIIKTRSLMPADKTMIGKSYIFRIFGHSIILQSSLFGLAREIYCKKVYFTIPGFLIGKNDVVIDLGANAGVFTILAAMCGRRVIAVEAQSEFIREIENNLKINKCTNNTSLVLGIIASDSGIFSDKSKLKSASHYRDEPPELTLSEIIDRFKIDKIDFLKIDIEGSEFNLFVQNSNLLSIINKIAMEVHPEFGDPKIIGELLKSKGFSVWYVDKNQQRVNRLTSIGFIFAKNQFS
jgi:FkbM family methyltransferase